MPSDPQECRQRALICANRAAACPSPAAGQKFADLAIIWLMLAVQFEEQSSVSIGTMRAKATPKAPRSPSD